MRVNASLTRTLEGSGMYFVITLCCVWYGGAACGCRQVLQWFELVEEIKPSCVCLIARQRHSQRFASCLAVGDSTDFSKELGNA